MSQSLINDRDAGLIYAVVGSEEAPIRQPHAHRLEVMWTCQVKVYLEGRFWLSFNRKIYRSPIPAHRQVLDGACRLYTRQRFDLAEYLFKKGSLLIPLRILRWRKRQPHRQHIRW